MPRSGAGNAVSGGDAPRPDDANRRPLAANEAANEERSFADVDESSAESFPASDPPSWASMRVGAPRAS